MEIGLCGGLLYRFCVVLRCIWRFGCVGGVGATTATIGRLLLLGVLVVAAAYVLFNLAADVVQAAVDPRLR